jgi:hypothetical protein
MTGITMLREGETRGRTQPLKIDPGACREDIEETLRRQTFVRAMFREHEVLNITYEELAGNNRDATFARIIQFLNAEEQPLKTVHVKLANDHLSAEIENLGELQSTFKGTPYENYFHE